MGYCISQPVFDSNFLNKNKEFSHRTNIRYNLFPFVSSTSDEPLDNFDNILGAFLCNIYSLSQPDGVNRDEIISNICKDMVFNSEADKVVFCNIIKDIYFTDSRNLKFKSVNTYKYTFSKKNDKKISEYIVSVLCDKNKIIAALSDRNSSDGNLFDKLVESHLPELDKKDDMKKYVCLMPKIAEYFTKDLICLINDKNFEFSDMIQLISYYYFFYTSQTILHLNYFCKEPVNIYPVYFCMDHEKTSRNRYCRTMGWHQIDVKLRTMVSHAVLLEMLNQTDSEKRYSYSDIFNEYLSASAEEKKIIYSSIEKLKNLYRTNYAKPEGFTYENKNYKPDDIESLIRGFFDDIMLQLEKSSRSRIKYSYKNSFYSFCKKNFLQNRGSNGFILVLKENLLLLLTKIIIGNEKHIRLNKLFKEFELRGIYMDNATKECVINFYEKLNLIEKKSDSEAAQYVKGIL